ncbi:hypothetical protein QVD99_007909 [Batrachochytrium dendrobatidis]|nr:hypothetical protein QVD99_007909 [Batrachochytrium dendrobatidis]
MKLAVTVLSSILLACSVTTANPVNPSATTSTDASTSTVSSLGNGYFFYKSIFSVGNKCLIKKYLQKKETHERARRVYDLLKKETEVQEKRVAMLNERYHKLIQKSKQGNGNLGYKDSLEKFQLELEKQSHKLDKLKDKHLKHSALCDKLFSKLWNVQSAIVHTFFKETPNIPTVATRIRLLESNPEIAAYISKLQNEMLKESPMVSCSRVMRRPRKCKMARQGYKNIPSCSEFVEDPDTQYPPLDEIPTLRLTRSTSKTLSSSQAESSSFGNRFGSFLGRSRSKKST